MASLHLRDDKQWLDIRGDMTAAEVPGLLRDVQSCQGVVHIDLSDVGRVDSSALAFLLACSRSAQGATVTVHHAPEPLRALNDLYGLQTLFWVV